MQLGLGLHISDVELSVDVPMQMPTPLDRPQDGPLPSNIMQKES